jgi:endonuclease-3 related protein
MFGLRSIDCGVQLLAVRGIGQKPPIHSLYAGKHPVFVIDAYTRRIAERHGIAQSNLRYEALRSLFENSLPRNQQLFNEFHALIVRVGKNYCRPRNPRCSECSLARFLPQLPEPRS